MKTNPEASPELLSQEPAIKRTLFDITDAELEQLFTVVFGSFVERRTPAAIVRFDGIDRDEDRLQRYVYLTDGMRLDISLFGNNDIACSGLRAGGAWFVPPVQIGAGVGYLKSIGIDITAPDGE